MTTQILVPLDESEQSWNALEYALGQFEDVEVTVLHVIDPIEAGYSAEVAVPGYTEEWYEQSKENAEALFERARSVAAEYDVTLHTALQVGRPVRGIVDYIEENEVDHVVMGSHGRSGVSRILLGSVAEGVVRRSPVPVTVVR